jgi:nickel transport protein
MKMKKVTWIFLVSLIVFPSISVAHFGMVIPSDTMIMQEDTRTINIVLSFSHPFEVIGMPLDRPTSLGVVSNNSKTDLLGSLKEFKVMDHPAWVAQFPIKRPGAYIFHMEPAPYWEPSEDVFIIHYTKTVVAAYGDDEGWDQEVGLRTEIVPLTKPFGLYAGNVFQGIVKLDGKAVPFSEVEIEYYNVDGKAKAPTDYMITQAIKSDANGIFTYAVPRAGWWGFAALNEADFKIKKDGGEKGVELGAVIWVKFHDWIE